MPDNPPATPGREGVTRRTIVAGTAWATPAIVASSVLPAFARSNTCKYCLASSCALYFSVDECGRLTNFQVSNNINGVSSDGYVMPRGFNVGYLPGEGKRTTASLDGSLDYYVAVPAGRVSSFSFTSGSATWNLASVTRNVRRLTIGQGETVTLDHGSYDVFKYRFVGGRAGTAAPLSTRTAPASWDGSIFSLTICDPGPNPYWTDDRMPFYAGAVGSFHTDDGFSVSNADSITMRWTS